MQKKGYFMSKKSSGTGRVTPKGTVNAPKGSRQARRKGADVVNEQTQQLHQGWEQKGKGQGFVPAHGQKSGHRGNR
jgi:hypothetical protein